MKALHFNLIYLPIFSFLCIFALLKTWFFISGSKFSKTGLFLLISGSFVPFTLIMIHNSRLWECRWDGQKKYHKLLDESIAHIWSSATLYDNGQQKLRQLWFKKWLTQNPSACLYKLFHFHKNTGEGNPEIDLVMNRADKLFTVSITGIAVNSSARLMQYIDLQNNDSTTIGFSTEREYI